MPKYAAYRYRCCKCTEEYVVGMCSMQTGWVAVNPECPGCKCSISWCSGPAPADDLPDDVLSDMFDIRAEIKRLDG